MGLNERMGLNGPTSPSDGMGPSDRMAPSEQPSAIHVDIGELALSGFGAGLDPERVSAAFQAELARLVRERGVPLAATGEGAAIEALSGLPPLPATTSPARLGEALARAVHAGLSGRGREGT
ncbi:hypothetical protein [Streptomyces rapamycinicus]|uniref:Uncharacterized protein n=2 Tax=Streptomyces rapamycinicus TaxID=1226757 RepID=A0A0A0NWT3_STRRN|nr:hypothetical protein [Streptomyces rapamycinicus]AGP60330.1 hypothetical protein M271_44810 [Streptomyces rapamycinicus NRRL 5491]MBB4788503.1 hypothetical protein [Streptomyces rapamycinicus]RLV72837.1 hypothetical protein D3C57_149960 [Streptomyces rapamycinicus NRRL 5491]UTP35908.1 hypothetical protein LIV37_45575 [Streptomyces rapamycinicus NRRL 5491]